jgi:hypothetical protein
MADLFAHLSVQLTDALGVTASVPYYLSIADTQTVAELNTAMAAILTDLDPVTGAAIANATVNISVTLPGGIKATPAAGSEVERGGLFNWSQLGIKYKFGVLVPALKQSVIVNGKINLADAAVSTWNALMSTVGGDVSWVSTGFHDLEVLRDALIVFRKHRKAESRRSSEVG